MHTSPGTLASGSTSDPSAASRRTTHRDMELAPLAHWASLAHRAGCLVRAGGTVGADDERAARLPLPPPTEVGGLHRAHPRPRRAHAEPRALAAAPPGRATRSQRRGSSPPWPPRRCRSVPVTTCAEWTTVTATGTFDPSQQVLIRNRSYQGQPGYHVVTPLEQADGTALLVNRGWVPLEGDDGELDVPPPPAGDVTVTGHVRPSQRKGRFFSPTDPADGTLDQLYRVDVPRVAQQVPYPLLPVYVELISLDPPAGEASGAGSTVASPVPIPPPEQDDGPHLSYAGQWVLFAACAVAGWVIVVRARQARAPHRPRASDAEHTGRSSEAAAWPGQRDGCRTGQVGRPAVDRQREEGVEERADAITPERHDAVEPVALQPAGPAPIRRPHRLPARPRARPAGSCPASTAARRAPASTGAARSPADDRVAGGRVDQPGGGPRGHDGLYRRHGSAHGDERRPPPPAPRPATPLRRPAGRATGRTAQS